MLVRKPGGRTKTFLNRPWGPCSEPYLGTAPGLTRGLSLVLLRAGSKLVPCLELSGTFHGSCASPHRSLSWLKTPISARCWRTIFGQGLFNFLKLHAAPRHARNKGNQLNWVWMPWPIPSTSWSASSLIVSSPASPQFVNTLTLTQGHATQQSQSPGPKGKKHWTSLQGPDSIATLTLKVTPPAARPTPVIWRSTRGAPMMTNDNKEQGELEPNFNARGQRKLGSAYYINKLLVGTWSWTERELFKKPDNTYRDLGSKIQQDLNLLALEDLRTPVFDPSVMASCPLYREVLVVLSSAAHPPCTPWTST